MGFHVENLDAIKKHVAEIAGMNPYLAPVPLGGSPESDVRARFFEKHATGKWQMTDHDGNWLESRMARLAGQFAGIVRIECPAETVTPRATSSRTTAREPGSSGARVTRRIPLARDHRRVSDASGWRRWADSWAPMRSGARKGPSR